MDITAPEIIISAKLLIPLLIPLIGVLGVMLFGEDSPNFREACSIIAATCTFLVVLSFRQTVIDGGMLQYQVFDILPGLSLTLRADAMSMIFALIASGLWILASIYSMGYMRGHHEASQTRFNSCFGLAIFGALGAAFSDNLFTMYFFYEFVSVTTYPLVAHHQDKEAFEGAKKYVVYLTTTAKGLVLPAMILIYVITGTLDFPTNIYDGMFHGTGEDWMVMMLFACCLFGFAKNGVMPFHHWLPGAMVAPTPVSALLHAVAVVKVGVFCTSRAFLYIFGVELMDKLNLGITTAYFVGFTIICASVIALTKDNLKARLAYSTVSQLSYIILGVCLITPMGMTGGLIHIANHAFSKITLFFCAGAIMVAAHKKCISEMGGLGRTMPFTFGAFAIASLSMIGAPPVAGFVTKWHLLLGTIESGHLGIIFILLGSTMLNIAYFAPVTIKAFFGKRPEGEVETGIKEAAWPMLVPLCITCAISVYIGIKPDFFMDIVKVVIG